MHRHEVPRPPVARFDRVPDDVVLPCRLHDADLWFAETPSEAERAKQLCGPCPVRVACLMSARLRCEPWGVWGGEIFERGVVVPAKRGPGRPRRARLGSAGTPAARSGRAVRKWGVGPPAA